jgi:3-methyladenine DNA glycosylase AlkC
LALLTPEVKRTDTVAEPLKNAFGPDIPLIVAGMVLVVHPSFNKERFVSLALDGYDALELTPRARQISDALAETLPADRREALEIITRSVGPEIEEPELTGMEGFRYLPFVFFVADHGTDHFEAAMAAQYELTKRFTAEFSIRAYLERYPDETLARLRLWAHDDNVHVRRLVSEGTRPRLPWAPQLKRFREDPMPVLALLELLKDDKEEYVRRSVANNLNDIAKDHPELVVRTAELWWNGDENRRRLVRHGLRTLIKQGDPGALAVLGYGRDSPTRIAGVAVTPEVVSIGESVRITVELSNPSDEPGNALVDIIVYFVKANGSTSPKVFKGGERSLHPGHTAVVSKLISVAQFSTRTHYPGTHRVEIQINGRLEEGGIFEIRE